MDVLAVPPVGLNVVATRSVTAPARRAARVAAFSVQLIVTMPAFAAVRAPVQAVTRPTAWAMLLRVGRVPRRARRPGPGTVTRGSGNDTHRP
ncbi:MAG: hypothetical protein FJW78_00390 [Actinobacteria bacterium]|nr:hypothetical protein [Actinomycetota bacterium]